MTSTHDTPTDPQGIPAQSDTAEIPVAIYLPGIMPAEHLWNRDHLWATTLEFALQPPDQVDDEMLQRRIQDPQQPWRSWRFDDVVRRRDLRQVLHYAVGQTDGESWMALITLADRRILLLDVQWSTRSSVMRRTAQGWLMVSQSIPDLVRWGLTEQQRQRLYSAPTFDQAHQQVQLHLQRWADGLLAQPPQHR